MSSKPTTERVRSYYERFAPKYDRSLRLWKRVLSIPEGRWWIGARARGKVLEIGVGTGLNIPFYRPEVHLTGLDLSTAMLAQARKRAAELGRDIDLKEGDAQALEFPADTFDTVVFGLSLCSIPDDRRAVLEGLRVLKPGGGMLLLEHVRSPSPVVRAGQRLFEPLTVRFQADHLTREPLEHVRALGMEIEELRRWAWGIMERVSARKPLST